MTQSGNFAFCSSPTDKSTLDNGEDSNIDPLKGTDCEPKRFYRLEEVVFAEPLSTSSVEESERTDQFTCSEEIELPIDDDNISVIKTKSRKYKKYSINIPDRQIPVCPKKNCNKTFLTITLLKAHIRKVHCTAATHICDRCGNRFKAKYQLKRHIVTHEETRVTCHVCHKQLSERTNLSQHLRSHSNTRPHQCAECPMSFLRKSTLNVHVQFVHKKDELICDKCDVRFASRVEWSRHKQSHRKDPVSAST